MPGRPIGQAWKLRRQRPASAGADNGDQVGEQRALSLLNAGEFLQTGHQIGRAVAEVLVLAHISLPTTSLGQPSTVLVAFSAGGRKRFFGRQSTAARSRRGTGLGGRWLMGGRSVYHALQSNLQWTAPSAPMDSRECIGALRKVHRWTQGQCIGALRAVNRWTPRST